LVGGGAELPCANAIAPSEPADSANVAPPAASSELVRGILTVLPSRMRLVGRIAWQVLAHLQRVDIPCETLGLRARLLQQLQTLLVLLGAILAQRGDRRCDPADSRDDRGQAKQRRLGVRADG
jgi:hypothetical protein